VLRFYHKHMLFSYFSCSKSFITSARFNHRPLLRNDNHCDGRNCVLR